MAPHTQVAYDRACDIGGLDAVHLLQSVSSFSGRKIMSKINRRISRVKVGLGL